MNHDQSNSTIRVFSRPDEFLNLVLPVLFLSLILGEVAFGYSLISDLDKVQTEFIKNVIFLNLIHNAFSFVVILNFPEIQTWNEGRRRNNQISVRRLLLATFVLFLIFFWLLRVFYAPDGSGKLKYPFLIAFGLAIAPTFHTLWQIRGISKTYSAQAKAILNESWHRFDRQETWLFRILLVLSSIQLFFNWHIGNEWLPFISDPNWVLIRKILLIATLATAALLPTIAICRGPKIFLNKAVFLLRILVLPLMSISPTAVLAFGSLHGVEYGFVFKKMYGNSKISKGHKGLVIQSLIITVIAVLFFYFWRTLFNTNTVLEHPTAFHLLAAVSVSLTYTHYAIDGLIFRMRDENTRKEISPLLT